MYKYCQSLRLEDICKKEHGKVKDKKKTAPKHSVFKHITNLHLFAVARTNKTQKHKVYTDLQSKEVALKQTVQCCKAPCT